MAKRVKMPSLKKQALDRLASMAAYGERKHEAKKRNGGKPDMDKITSIRTMNDYRIAAAHFAEWASGQGCRTLEDARAYTGQYLQKRMIEGKSAWTVRQDAAALAKLYQVRTTELGVKLPSRRREDITQHRTKAWRGHFSEERNRDLVELCRATGLRRHEVAALRPRNVKLAPDGRVIVHVHQGKGGKTRDVVSLTDAPWRLAEAARAKNSWRVIDHIPHRAPCHEYRAEYAREMYARIARDPATLPKRERYCARGDRAGQWYDRAAMQVVSENLGHTRLDVVMSYLP